MTMWAWRDLGHGWVVGNQSVVCGLTACVPLLQLPLSALSLFVFWQRIIGGSSMQIAYCGLKWYGKACAVQCYIHIHNPVLLLPGLCVVLLVRQCLLPLRSLWRGPSLSWSPGYPGWSFPAGRGESLPQTGWSYVSRSFHLKQIWWFILCRCSGLHTNMWKQTALNKNGKKLNELLVI